MNLLLIHGMGRTPLSMWRLARHLRRNGHEVTLAGYSVTFERFGPIVERLTRRLLALAARGEPYAVVAHSLGGILAQTALPGVWPLPEHLILLGTPSRPPRLAVRLASRWPYRLINGECGQLLSRDDFFASLPRLDVRVTSIAGTSGPRGKWSPFGDVPNDWVVAEDEMWAPDVTVRGTHTFLMNHREVREVVLRVLARR